MRKNCIIISEHKSLISMLFILISPWETKQDKKNRKNLLDKFKLVAFEISEYKTIFYF